MRWMQRMGYWALVSALSLPISWRCSVRVAASNKGASVNPSDAGADQLGALLSSRRAMSLSAGVVRAIVTAHGGTFSATSPDYGREPRSASPFPGRDSGS